MIVHDLHCNRCGILRRDVLLKRVEEIVLLAPCSCGGRFEIIWLKPPSIVGTETNSTWFRPGYNVQLGKTFHSFDEHQKYVKERGIEVVGPDEAKRNHRGPSTDSSDVELPGFKDLMRDTWEETVIGGKVYQPKKLDETPTVAVDS